MPPRQRSRVREEESLYKNEEDRKHLESLSEAVREGILYERHLQLTEEKERKELKHRNSSFGMESETDSESRGMDSFSERSIPKIVTKTSFDVFKNVVLRRDMLLDIVYRRAIDKIKGCYVKLRLTEGYCVYKIQKVYEGKRYEVSGVVTNKWMTLVRNKDRKEINIQSISNGHVTPEEYDRYIKDNVVPGGDRDLLRLYKKLSRNIETDTTDDDIDYSLSQKRRFSKYEKIAAKRRVVLTVQLERARQEENLQEIQEIEKELREMEEHAEGSQPSDK
ncbi:uncharacterized protein NEMAJ01_1063 [Nematocida major]|uniref:uncharacterized protein n=1 Tax=Nematocida major TaxID=1912982 RepID=UPI0020088F17|nr:uncharacterized protein NEMAJ01_1063 [Nematocida major]KAH9386167.1 hypothetical protein NEMAJ01_1063 [Nematocida major]